MRENSGGNSDCNGSAPNSARSRSWCMARTWDGAARWRFPLTLTGTPADLALSTSDSVDDFRRYDLAGRRGCCAWRSQCNAHYHSVDHTLPGVSCQAPIGGGFLRLDGSVAGAPGCSSYDLALLAQDVPMQSLVALAEHAKKDIPEDLVATGKLDAAFKFERKMQGRPTSAGLVGRRPDAAVSPVASALAKTELTLDSVPFSVVPGTGRGQQIGGAPAVPAIDGSGSPRCLMWKSVLSMCPSDGRRRPWCAPCSPVQTTNLTS